MFFFLTALAIVMLFTAGFISGLLSLAADEPEAKKPPFTRNKRTYLSARVAEYTLLILSLYILVVTSGVIIAAIYYLFMEYGLPRVLKPAYQKYFGLPSEAAE